MIYGCHCPYHLGWSWRRMGDHENGLRQVTRQLSLMLRRLYPTDSSPCQFQFQGRCCVQLGHPTDKTHSSTYHHLHGINGKIKP